MTAFVLGLAVGLSLGLIGAGGGVCAVPLLMWGLGWTLTQAAPVALLTVCIAAAFGTVAAWDISDSLHDRTAGMPRAYGIKSSSPLRRTRDLDRARHPAQPQTFS